ncbi:hypothetical protein L6V77_13935 [Myxococcota bacterium]|nr:hypothetical protein [Myxococcota bacterium]
MKPAHRRRRAPRGITSLETIVFVPVLVIFWLAFRYFAEEWTSVQLMGPVAGNAAYDRAMGKQPPGTAGLANQRSVTVNAAMQGPTDGSDYPYGVPWHLVDKKLANQRGGTAKVDIRIVPKPREYQSTWRVDRALAMSAVVQAPPTRPPVGQVGMDENAYNDKVQDFLNGKFQPFGW